MAAQKSTKKKNKPSETERRLSKLEKEKAEYKAQLESFIQEVRAWKKLHPELEKRG